jgi:hypothetical protein
MTTCELEIANVRDLIRKRRNRLEYASCFCRLQLNPSRSGPYFRQSMALSRAPALWYAVGHGHGCHDTSLGEVDPGRGAERDADRG